MKREKRREIVSVDSEEDSPFLLNRDMMHKLGMSKSYSRWSKSENIAYAKFLRENISEFYKCTERRSSCFFNRMAETLGDKRNN